MVQMRPSTKTSSLEPGIGRGCTGGTGRGATWGTGAPPVFYRTSQPDHTFFTRMVRPWYLKGLENSMY